LHRSIICSTKHHMPLHKVGYHLQGKKICTIET
jgi:hypothetical protein